MSVRVGERERVVAIYESPFGTFSIIAAVEFRSKVGQPSSHSALLSQSLYQREMREGCKRGGEGARVHLIINYAH